MADRSEPITVSVTTRHAVTHLHVNARVRYWEDSTVNGVEDDDGALIPLRSGDSWAPVIDLATGHIAGWPAGTIADIHYKVCDDGDYWLSGPGVVADYRSSYVPDLLAVEKQGFGDYIILKVDGDGMIRNWWKLDPVDPDEWKVRESVE